MATIYKNKKKSQFNNNITVLGETKFQINISKWYHFVHKNVKTKLKMTYTESRKLTKNNKIK